MRYTQLADWLSWLEQQHPKAIDLGLERIQGVASCLGVNHLDATVITVAGTNGKGSFVASLHALLMSQGINVASYTSPHIESFNERIRINKQYIDDQALVAIFDQIDQARGDISLTYFEFTTLAALLAFKQQDLDVVILEVGLGGRLDAVNVVDPDWAVLTSIGLDHQDYLGDDVDSIASEKLGILRDDTPLLNLCREPIAALEKAKQNRQLLDVERDFSVKANGLKWQFNDNELGLAVDGLSDNGLAITSQAGAAILANRILPKPLTAEQIKEIYDDLTLAGRFQHFYYKSLDVFVDVAHNIQAVSLLKQRLQNYPLAEGGKRIAIFNMFVDKDADSVIDLVKDDMTAWFIAEDGNPRAFTGRDMAAKLHDHGIHMISVSKNAKQALARVTMFCQPGDQVIIFGSFMLASSLLNKLNRAS